MSKYVLLFSKTGYIRFTSHLDLLRIFKRAFRRAGIQVSYSQGFNPHPRMGFCQPLSLGYSALGEMIEFQTDNDTGRSSWTEELMNCLPSGIDILKIGLIGDGQKSLAASVYAADYDIGYPVPFGLMDFAEEIRSLMAEEQILCMKKMKGGSIKEVNIRDKIRDLAAEESGGRLLIKACLDSGSASNLSPELLINVIHDRILPFTERYDIDVCRKKLYIDVDYKITWM